MHLGSHAHGEVERGRAHPAADADDEAALARRQPGPLEHPPRREGGQRVGGALLPGASGRTRDQVAGRHDDPLGVAAPPLLPEDLEAATERGIVPVGDDRLERRHGGVHHDLVADRPPVDAVAQLLHDAGHVAARHVGQRRPWLAPREPEVHVVQGAGDGPHRHVAGADRRVRRWCRSGTNRATRRGSRPLHRALRP